MPNKTYVCICEDEFRRFCSLERHIVMSVIDEPGCHRYDYSYEE